MNCSKTFHVDEKVLEIVRELRESRNKRLILSCLLVGLLNKEGEVKEGDLFLYTLSYENFSELLLHVPTPLLLQLEKLLKAGGEKRVEKELEEINRYYLFRKVKGCLEFS